MLWLLWWLLKLTLLVGVVWIVFCLVLSITASVRVTCLLVGAVIAGSAAAYLFVWPRDDIASTPDGSASLNALRDAGRTLLSGLRTADDAIAQTGQELHQQLDAFEQMAWTSETSPGDFLRNCHRVVAELRTLAKETLATHQRLVAQAQLFDGLVAEAPLRLRALAAGLREDSLQESYEDIRQDYEHAAAVLDAFATHYEAELTRFRPAMEELVELLPYVEATIRFLDAFHAALEEVNDLPTPELTEQLVAQLRDYVQRFEKLRQSLRSFRDQLTPAEPPSTAAEYTSHNHQLRPDVPCLLERPAQRAITSSSAGPVARGRRQFLDELEKHVLVS